ncbi:MAG: PorT family protein, partial [Muriicola sp.]|nr:PorT family protein [Muriicola sp.]
DQKREQPSNKAGSESKTALVKNKSIEKESVLKQEDNSNKGSSQAAEDSRLAVSEVIRTTSDDQTTDAGNKKEVAILEKGLPDTALALVEEGENAVNNKKEVAKRSIFEEVEKDTALTESNRSKWAVGPKVAPVFFSSLAQGSPIHSSFENNAKSGNINFSYGVSVSYEISKKLQVRTGIHKVDYGYDTNDVSFSSSLNAPTSSLIDNIDYSLTSKNLVVKSNLSSRQASSLNAMDVSATDPTLNGRMIQEFGYLEIPVELSYALINKKIGVNLIGGLSSLFLTNNSVILESEGIATQMGEANNINDLNLSTNIGLGIFYRVGTTMQIHVEPMFKYQLNTFANTVGNFQPYSLGVYSGLSFRF